MAIRKLIVALLCLLMPLSAQAFEGEILGERLTAKNTNGIEILIDYDVKWQISHLLGEPTRNLVIRWDLADVAWDQWYGEELAQVIPQGFQLNDLPPDIRESIRLYDVSITLGFRPNQNDISIIANGYVTFDAGSPAKAGEKWSFNVSGSPDWSEFMTQFNGIPMSEGEAKAVMKLPELYGRVESARVTAKVNLGEALRWMRKTYDKRPTEELIAGAESQLSVLNDTLALPVDGPEAEFEQLRSELQRADTPDEISAIHRKVEAAATKLSEGIPVRYIPAGKSNEYRDAREEVTRQVEIILGALIPDESAFEADANSFNEWSQSQNALLAKQEEMNRPKTAPKPEIPKLELVAVQTRVNLAGSPDSRSVYGFKVPGEESWAIEPRFAFFDDQTLKEGELLRVQAYTNVRCKKEKINSSFRPYLYSVLFTLEGQVIDVSGNVVEVFLRSEQGNKTKFCE